MTKVTLANVKNLWDSIPKEPAAHIIAFCEIHKNPHTIKLDNGKCHKALIKSFSSKRKKK